MPLFAPEDLPHRPAEPAPLPPAPLPNGVRHWPGHLDAAAQAALLDEIAGAVAQAPLYHPKMPRSGRPMSVAMTNLGPLGWYTDQALGYRYIARHPQTGAPWPAIPDVLLRLWNDLTGYPAPPECCLVNVYRGAARMGLHRDGDEQALDAPVLSVSLGDTGLFRLGGLARRDGTASFRLASGDVVCLGGPARLRFHGLDRIDAGTSALIEGGGRINLTLRRVTRPG